MKDNRTYYDDFASWYERERHGGYHAMIDELQTDLIKTHCVGKNVLEIGCGTGMILKEIHPIAQLAKGIDISPGMLEQAQARGLDVVEGSATSLPFEDASFDVIYSFKVLAHVEQIQEAMSEVARVLKPGGIAALEFYNPRSIRGLIKRLKSPTAVSAETNDEEVFTRYDTLADVRTYLPETLKVSQIHGVRIFTPAAFFHKIPLLGTTLRGLEWKARDSRFWSRFGGFMVVSLERIKD
jgi:ubiquinone/menaquinone biosynthesis C-methylase UbiE